MQTDRLIDLRVACLERRKAHLATLVDVFIGADAAVVQNVVQATRVAAEPERVRRLERAGGEGAA